MSFTRFVLADQSQVNESQRDQVVLLSELVVIVIQVFGYSALSEA